jgi:hypothetical protein
MKNQTPATCKNNGSTVLTTTRAWDHGCRRRRSQTEGRISIVKHVFLGQRLRSKGFEHRELAVTWTVLVHNLWVLARMGRPAEAALAQKKAA